MEQSFKDHAHRDLGSRDFVDGTAIQNSHFVSIIDFSGFLCKVGTRQKRKISTFSFCVSSCLCCNFKFLPHATRLQKCVLRLLAGDIAIPFLRVFSCVPDDFVRSRRIKNSWTGHRCKLMSNSSSCYLVRIFVLDTPAECTLTSSRDVWLRGVLKRTWWMRLGS